VTDKRVKDARSRANQTLQQLLRCQRLQEPQVKRRSAQTATMSTTTDILFNSPALNSLKRDQLVKLCKIHSVKASGKNVELIARLKQVAETLPKDAPLSIAARSEEDNEESEKDDDEKENFIGGLVRGPRMESIVEESSSQGSLSSHRSRDFGTASSKSEAFLFFSLFSRLKSLSRA
jgi:hypothetical protein